MYCKKCGTQIDDDSKFCKNCGEKQTKNESIKKEKSNKTKAEKTLIIMTIIVAVIVTISLIGQNCKNSNNNNNKTSDNNDDYDYNEPQLFTRNARNADIQIEYENDFTELAIDIIIMPNVDIDNLEIKVQHYDKNGNILLTQYKTIGNVKEGIQAKTQMKLLDLSLSDMFKVEKTSITVTGGTVSYFQ